MFSLSLTLSAVKELALKHYDETLNPDDYKVDLIVLNGGTGIHIEPLKFSEVKKQPTFGATTYS